MNSETKICQNCKQSFTIEPEDFDFYERIKVPPPTWCPQCRFRRRIIFRNELNLYRRKCDLCGKNIVSVYKSPSAFPVYCNSCWFSDDWDPLVYGTSYDKNSPFLAQFRQLLDKVPRLALNQFKNTNCEYTNFSAECKNCYLSVSILQCEDSAYSSRAFYSRDVFDCLDISRCENCYQCVRCEQCSRTTFAQFSESLIDSHYCFDCKGLTNCFGCVALRNKSYHFLNQPLGKEEYLRRVAEVRTNDNWGKFMEDYRQLIFSRPRRYAYILKSQICSGDYIVNSKNSKNCFFIKDLINSKNVFNASNLKDSYDISWDDDSELSYEVMSGEKDYSFRLGASCWYSQFVEYSSFCLDSKNIFGCVGLRKKEFCILNKLYSEKDFLVRREDIVRGMGENVYRDARGRTYSYGEFLPPEFSSFAYNETVNQQYFPLNREGAVAKGYAWLEPETKEYQITLSESNLPEIQRADESILQETIGCAHQGECNQQCTTAFKVIPQELQFYKRMNLPLPRLCPNCRHYERLAQRNPLKLWHRKCQCAGRKSEARNTKSETTLYQNTAAHFHKDEPCPNEFETSYAPERKEIVYCEACYNAEVV
ncbi:MAG: hypothetical protein AAB686_00945 [Patescibacteria group bacterium]